MLRLTLQINLIITQAQEDSRWSVNQINITVNNKKTSYDINISSLSVASNYVGAFEIAINYGWNTRRKNKQQIMTCPKYL